MSLSAQEFAPVAPMLSGVAAPTCRAIVTIPARNEATCLPRCLDALHNQITAEGERLGSDAYEVLLLLNNTTDRSREVAQAWKAEHADLALHVLERSWPAEDAHVGTARRYLMDTAWTRLQRTSTTRTTAILATDADSVVAPDWIAQNLRALEEGADVVGGQLHLLPEDLTGLPVEVQRRYWRDRHYASLVARLEDELDPRPGDRCPRHLDHFGASLGCSPGAYAAAGGMPMYPYLEDEAFVDGVRRSNRVLRHDPRVRVYTSARLDGRAAVGMSGQLRMWGDLPNDAAHTVLSAAFLQHRFRYLKGLREIFRARRMSELRMPTEEWKGWVETCLRDESTCPAFFGAINSEALTAETFQGAQKQPIEEAIEELEAYLEGKAVARTGSSESAVSAASSAKSEETVATSLSGVSVISEAAGARQ